MNYLKFTLGYEECVLPFDTGQELGIAFYIIKKIRALAYDKEFKPVLGKSARDISIVEDLPEAVIEPIPSDDDIPF